MFTKNLGNKQAITENIDISMLPAGYYNVLVKSNAGSKTVKLIKF